MKLWVGNTLRPSSSSMPDAIVWKKGKSEPKYCKMDCAQLVYNDELIRQIIEVVIVESKEKIKIIFKGGLTVEENL